MKTAFLWGTVFGGLQAIITLVASIYFSSPNVASLAYVGLLLSFSLTVVCGLIGAIQAKMFSVGFWAGMIATVFDVVAGLIGYLINPALLQVGLIASAISFAMSIVFGVVLSAAGAGFGFLIYSKLMKPAQTKSLGDPLQKEDHIFKETIMETRQISNRETVGIGCLVSVGASIIVVLLAGSYYVLPLVFAYILLAFPFSLIGAFVGKKLATKRIGIWIGAILAAFLELWWLYSNASYLVFSD